MGCGTSIREKVAGVEIALNTIDGSPSPSASVSNGIVVKFASTADLEPEMLSQDDIANNSLSPVVDRVGKLPAVVGLTGNLLSTDQTDAPAIGVGLKLCGCAEETIKRLDLDLAPTNVAVGDTVTNGTATGVCKFIINNSSTPAYAIIVDVTGGTFADDDAITSGGDAVGTVNGAPTNAFLYAPDTDSTDTGSIFWYVDGTRRAVKNAKANFMMTATNGGFVEWTLDALGAYDVDNWEDASLPAISFKSLKNPLFMGAVPSITYGATTYEGFVLNSMDFNLGNNVVNIGDAGQNTGICGASIIDRNSAGGTLTIKESLLSIFDYVALMRDATPIQVNYMLGDGSKTKTVTVTQNAVITGIQRTSIDNIMYIQLQYKAIGTADDEQYLIFS
jgi:hypothetical protein